MNYKEGAAGPQSMATILKRLEALTLENAELESDNARLAKTNASP